MVWYNVGAEANRLGAKLKKIQKKDGQNNEKNQRILQGSKNRQFHRQTVEHSLLL